MEDTIIENQINQIESIEDVYSTLSGLGFGEVHAITLFKSDAFSSDFLVKKDGVWRNSTQLLESETIDSYVVYQLLKAVSRHFKKKWIIRQDKLIKCCSEIKKDAVIETIEEYDSNTTFVKVFRMYYSKHL